MTSPNLQNETTQGIHILLMGVSGCGKTSLAKLLAQKLGFEFIEADDFHPEENIAKMSQGIPLNDKDRMPWLNLVARRMDQHDYCVLACSALKKKYRDILFQQSSAKQVIFYLKGSYDLILKRMNDRKGHFMPPDLLLSQFEALEEPRNAFLLDISLSVESLLSLAINKIQSIQKNE